MRRGSAVKIARVSKALPLGSLPVSNNPGEPEKLVSIDFKKMSLLRLEPSAAHRNRSPRFVLHALASWFGSRDGFIDSLLSFSPGQE